MTPTASRALDFDDSLCRRTSCSRPTASRSTAASYYTGVSNIYRYDLASADSSKRSPTPRPASSGRCRSATTSCSCSATPARASCRSRIDPTPIEDVSAITFLGTEIAEKQPGGARSGSVGSPRDADFERTSATERSATEPAHAPGARVGLSDRAGLQGLRGPWACASTSSDPLSFEPLSMTATYSPDDELRRRRALPRRASSSGTTTGRFRGTWNRRRLLRSLRPHQDAAARATRSRRRLRPSWSTTTRAFWTSRRARAYCGDLDTLPDYQDDRGDPRSSSPARGGLQYDYVRKSLGGVDEEKGSRWVLRARGDLRRVRRHPAPARRRSTCGLPLPIDHSSIWLRSRGRARHRRPRRPVRQLLLRRLRQQLRRSRHDEKRYREYDVVPRRRDQRGRRAQLRQGDGRVEPAAAALPRRRARRRSTSTGCGRRCSSAVLQHQPRSAWRPRPHRRHRRRADRPQDGPDLEHACDAVGGLRHRGRRTGDDSDEFMISLKIL